MSSVKVALSKFVLNKFLLGKFLLGKFPLSKFPLRKTGIGLLLLTSVSSIRLRQRFPSHFHANGKPSPPAWIDETDVSRSNPIPVFLNGNCSTETCPTETCPTETCSTRTYSTQL